MPTPPVPDTYLFTDQLGNDQVVDVVRDFGVLCARFVDDEGHVDLVPVADMDGDWVKPDDEVPAHQREQPYFISVLGVGAKQLPDEQRIALEDAFRVAFNQVCGDTVLRVVFAHKNGDGDILDPRAGGPGFYEDLERKAVQLMTVNVPDGLYFDCAYNYALAER